MYAYLTINDLEDDMVSIFKQIERDIGAADDDGIMVMMQDVTIIAWHVDNFAAATDEWSLFEACLHYREYLRSLYDSLDSHLCSA